MAQMAGLLNVIGSLAFLFAAFMPITTVFVIQRDAARLANRRTEWVLSLLLFALGGTVTAMGMALLALDLGEAQPAAATPAYLGLAALAVAAVIWDIIIFRRYIQPLALAVQRAGFSWLFAAYTLLSQAGLVAYGIALLQAGYPGWLAWGTIFLALLLAVAFFVFKDVPPFAYYIITLIIGIVLLR